MTHSAVPGFPDRQPDSELRQSSYSPPPSLHPESSIEDLRHPSHKSETVTEPDNASNHHDPKSFTEFKKEIAENYLNWNTLTKNQKAERLQKVCEQVSQRAVTLAVRLTNIISELPEVDTRELAQTDPAEIKKLLLQEFHAEQEVRACLRELLFSRALLEKEPLKRGRGLYRSSTGIFDNQAKLSALAATCTGFTTLAAAGWFIIETHHMLVHQVQHTFEFLSHGIGGRVGSELLAVVPLVIEATVLISAGAYIGPRVYGMIKAGLGRLNRMISSKARNDFSSQAVAAGELNSTFKQSVDQILEVMQPISDETLRDFYDRNQNIGSALQSHSWKSAIHKSKHGEEQPESSKTAEHLYKLHEELGVMEASDKWEALLICDSLRDLKETSVMSVALEKESLKLHGRSENEVSRKNETWKLGIRSFLDMADEIWQGSVGVGVDAAIQMSHDIDKWCHDNRHSVLAPVVGPASVLAHTLGVSMASSDIIKALKDTFEGGAHLLTLDKEWSTGPSLAQLGWKGFGLDELDFLKSQEAENQQESYNEEDLDLLSDSQKKDSAWGDSLAKKIPFWNKAVAAWKFQANLIYFTSQLPLRFVILIGKKPLLIQQLVMEQARSGHLTPELVEQEILSRRGSREKLTYAAQEITGASKKALYSLYKLPTELPLRIAASLQRRKSFLSQIIPFRASDSLIRRYEQRIDSVTQGPHGLSDYADLSLPGGKELSRIALSELPANIKYALNECKKGNEAFSEDLVLHLAHYWRLRIAQEWLAEQLRQEKLSDAILEEGSHLYDLRTNTMLSDREIKNWVDDTEASGLTEPYPLNPKTRKYITGLNAQRPKEAATSGSVILSAAPKKQVVMKLPNGKLRALGPFELIHKYKMSYKTHHQKKEKRGVDSFVSSIRILDEAHEARIAVAQALLGKLEPHQQQAFIEAHQMSLQARMDFSEQVQLLRNNDFTQEQLFGSQQQDSDDDFPGIFRLGLIGNTIPSEVLIKSIEDTQHP